MLSQRLFSKFQDISRKQPNKPKIFIVNDGKSFFIEIIKRYKAGVRVLLFVWWGGLLRSTKCFKFTSASFLTDLTRKNIFILKENENERMRMKNLTFHLSAHFLENSAKTTFSSGCFFLCSSRQVWTKKAYAVMRPLGLASALARGILPLCGIGGCMAVICWWTWLFCCWGTDDGCWTDVCVCWDCTCCWSCCVGGCWCCWCNCCWAWWCLTWASTTAWWWCLAWASASACCLWASWCCLWASCCCLCTSWCRWASWCCLWASCWCCLAWASACCCWTICCAWDWKINNKFSHDARFN